MINFANFNKKIMDFNAVNGWDLSKNLLQKIFKNYPWLKCRTLKFIIWFNSGSADAVESFDDKDKFIIWSKVVDFNDGEADETITED